MEGNSNEGKPVALLCQHTELVRQFVIQPSSKQLIPRSKEGC